MKKEIEKIIKTAMDNGFKFGCAFKNPNGFKFYNFGVESGDMRGYEIELEYVKSTPQGSDYEYLYFDFTTLLFNKNFMTNLFKKVPLYTSDDNKTLRYAYDKERKVATYRLVMQVYNDIYNSGINAGIKTIISIIERGE